jgi:hypothetical protein
VRLAQTVSSDRYFMKQLSMLYLRMV